MIRELDTVREQALEAQHDSASRTVKALCTIRGIGVNFASVLTREVFYRTFDNRQQIASYLGLAPTPFQSGGMDRDRHINRAGNSRARKTLVGRASWGHPFLNTLMHQKETTSSREEISRGSFSINSCAA